MAECSPQLLSVVLIDQRQRWTKGERPRVEAYLRDVPELSSDREGLLDFIYQEVLLREESGDVPSADDYASRFPDLSTDLKIQFEVHRHLPRPPKPVRTPDSVDLPNVDGFVISEVIGRGGFGVVYRAWDQSLQRTVALKLLTDRAEPGRKNRSRFADEAQAAARLSHPNIVQIHSVRSDPECSYFCLEHVEGGTLADVLNGQPQPNRQSAEFVATLARAVHYAHLCRVVHCDLKPANILLQPRTDSSRHLESNGDGEVASKRPPGRLQDFDAKITDFGLARRLDTEGGLESAGLAGTLPYMAPEQLSGEAAQAAPAVDIYALGAILYEMLTGRPPFVSDSILQVFLSVRGGAPKSPRELRPELPEDLNAICLKCLERNPSRRYPTAQALADDLKLFVEGREVSVRPLNWPLRADRWRRRNPLPASLLGLLIAVIAVSFVMVAAKMLQAQRAERAERKRSNELDATLYLNQFLLADQAVANRDVARATEILENTNPTRRSMEWDLLKRALRGQRVRWPHVSKVAPSRLAISSNGRWIAASDTEDSTTTLIDTRTGRPIHVLKGSPRQFADPVFNPAGTAIATSDSTSSGEFAVIWDVETGTRRLRIGPLGGRELAAAFMNDGRQLITLCAITDGLRLLLLETWDVSTGERVQSVRGPYANKGATPPKATLSLDGRYFAWTEGGILADDQTVYVGDSSTGKQLHPFAGHPGGTYGMTFSPDGESLVTFGHDAQAVVWRMDGSELARLSGHTDAVFNVSFSADGRQIATASHDTTVQIWDAATGNPLRQLQAGGGLARAAVFDPRGQFVVTASSEGDISKWLLTAPPPERALIGGRVKHLAISRDGRYIVTSILGMRVHVYDRTSSNNPVVLDRPFADCALSADGSTIAAVDEQGKLWLIPLGESGLHPTVVEGVPPLNSSGAQVLAWRPDGREIAAVLADGVTVVGVDAGTHDTRWTARSPQKSIDELAWRADGRQLASRDPESKDICLWNTSSGALERTITAQAVVHSIVYRPGSDDLVVVPQLKTTLQVWNSATGELRLKFPAHKRSLTDIACTPDGKRFVTGSIDRTVRIWDAETGTQLLVLDEPKAVVGQVAISADGQFLGCMSGSGATPGELTLWDASAGSVNQRVE